MTSTGDGWGDAARWYPDVVAAGDAATAWQAEFDRQGIPLRSGPADGVNPRRARVLDGDRRADLLLSPWQRRFRLSLRTGRRTMAVGWCPDVATASAVAQPWLAGERPGPITAAWPFLGSTALAEARERGDQRESRWLWLYENHCQDPIGIRLRPFLELAFPEPRLRALRPWTSHWRLSFSAKPDWPYDPGYPVVDPVGASGRFVVRAGGRAYDETGPAATLRHVLAELPE